MSTKITITCPACRKLTTARDVEPDNVHAQNCNVCHAKIDVQRTAGGTLIIGLAPNAVDKPRFPISNIGKIGDIVSIGFNPNCKTSVRMVDDADGWFKQEPGTMTHSERNAIIDAYIAIVNSAEAREDYETCALYRDKINALKIK